jgi:serine/threonine protein kinase
VTRPQPAVPEPSAPGDARGPAGDGTPDVPAQAGEPGTLDVPAQVEGDDTPDVPARAGEADTPDVPAGPAATKLDVREGTDADGTDRAEAGAGPETAQAEAITGFPGIQKNGMLLGNRYRLNERIAIGGMGQVWRATDELLGRPVAVKLLSARHAADEQFRTRFQAEARYAASLSHRGIARVYDYGESGEGPGAADAPGSGVPYLVMELVEGEPLSAAIARDGRMPADVTLDIVAQSARALATAHAAGIVHRDIKPGNLLLTPERQVKITDFGIARAMQGTHLTQTGMVMGTAQYVSPEQASARPVTSASDIYSLGVVAYECLAGHPPFTAEAPIALALAHVNKPPPPLPDDVPAPVAALVGQMLAKDPAARPASANAVADRASALRGAAQDGQDRWLTGPTELANPAVWFADPTPTTLAEGHDRPGTPGGTTIAAGPATPAARSGRRVAAVLAAAAVVLAATIGVVLALTMGKPGASQPQGHGPPRHPAATRTRQAARTPGINDVGTEGPGPSPTPDADSAPASSRAAPSSPATNTPSSSPSPSQSPTGSPTPTSSPTTTPTSPSPTPTGSTTPAQVTQQAGSLTASAMTQDG